MSATAATHGERDARAIANDYLNQAWAAFEDHRLERGSTFIWKATEVALRCAAAKRGMTVDTPDERIEFVELLDAESRNEHPNHYIAALLANEHYRYDSELGVMPGDDPAKYADLAVEFINELLTMAESAE